MRPWRRSMGDGYQIWCRNIKLTDIILIANEKQERKYVLRIFIYHSNLTKYA
jgi:hypothetical protein